MIHDRGGRRIVWGAAALLAAAAVMAQDTGTQATASAPAAAPGKIQHAAIGAEAKAASTHKGLAGEGQASALVDGDLKTRWSSEYAEPQEVILKLRAPVRIKTLRLHWESASAARYCVSVSTNGNDWSSVHLYLKDKGKAEPRVDEVTLNAVPAQWIKLDLISRINKQWGFSLYEVEVRAAE
jgi:chondroitin AC lyase